MDGRNSENGEPAGTGSGDRDVTVAIEDASAGEMLDPSWTPERGRSHVAALAGLREEGES